MENISVGKYTYFDDQNFPHGFRRSGIFTIKEAEFLETYGQTLLGLEKHTYEPINQEEALFQKAILGEAESNSFAVRTWRKYRAAIASKSEKIFMSPHSGDSLVTNQE